MQRALLLSGLLAAVSGWCESDTRAQDLAEWTGDVVITTQAEADALSCVTRICGSLTVRPVEPVVTLPNLREITGALNIEVEPTAPGRFVTAEQVVLPELRELGGKLSFQHLNGDYGAEVELGLPLLAAVPGDVELVLSSFNGHNTGLAGLSFIGGDLTITARGDFYAFDLLEALTRVDGDVHVRTNAGSSGSVLRGLQSVGGDLTLDYLSRLAGNVLSSLREVDGDLNILRSYWGPDQFLELQRVGGTFRVQGIPGIDPVPGSAIAGSPAGLQLGALELRQTNYPVVPLVAGTAVAECGAIVIEDNADLCQTSVDDFVSAQAAAGWSGPLSVSGNLGSCTP